MISAQWLAGLVALVAAWRMVVWREAWVAALVAVVVRAMAALAGQVAALMPVEAWAAWRMRSCR
jgi:hypothetical protein